MSRDTEFAAEILERGASAFAGYSVERLFEIAPAAREQFADGASRDWQAHLRSRILELAAAVRLDEPQIFVSRVLWTRDAFRARDLPPGYLASSLNALSDVLGEELPESVKPLVSPILEPALHALSGSEVPGANGLLADTPEGRLSLKYLLSALEGDSRGATDLVLSAVRDGLDPRDAVTKVLFPAQREIGRMWHEAETDIAEEHLVTATTLRAMAVLGGCGRDPNADGRTVVVAAVQGNDHEVAVHGLGLFFELEGWKSVVLGANVPAPDLVRSMQLFGANLLVLSVTLGVQLREAQRAIEAIRAIPGFDVPVLVGGQAFVDAPDLWRRIGADGYAGSLEAAVEEGTRLINLPD